jgi:hypothetical protein
MLGTRKTAVLRIIDASQTVGFQLANYDVSESVGTATVQVERTGDVSGAMTVTFTTSDGTALAGTDYTAVVAIPVAFAVGQTVATASVPIIDNKVVAADKVLNLTLTAPTAPFVLATGRNTATLTLKDEDVAGVIAFAASGFVAQEKDGQAVITIVRSGGTAGCPLPLGPAPSCPDATLVTFSTADGTATVAGADYTAVSTQVEFGAGELTKTVIVPINPDLAVEGTETVALTLTAPLPAGFTGRSPTLGTAAATLQIVETEFRVSATAYTVGEGTGKATITVVRTGSVTLASTIDFTTADGTATTGAGDYGATSGTLSFAADVSVLSFDVILTDDTIAETDESFDVVFSNPTGATIGRTSCATATPAAPALVATCTVTVTVLDGDSGGVFSFSQPVYDVNENAGTATITVRRIVGGAGPLTVDFATSDGSALAGTDYTATTQILTFAAGDVSKTATVPLLNGTVGIRSANLLLRNATGGATIGTPSSALLRITDVGNSVGFGAIGYTVDEAAGTAAITVIRTGITGDVLVNFATSDGTATAGSDYTATATTVTFPAGVTSRTVLVPITNDALLESNELLTLTLSNPVLAGSLTPVAVATDSCLTSTLTTCTASLRILDDDQGGVISLSSATYSVNENAGTATIGLTRTGGLAGGVTVAFAATAGTAAPGDFSVPSATVTFLAGQTTATAQVTIVDNLLVDANRTVNLAISNPQPAALAGSPILGPGTAAVLTIFDNEPRVRFAAPAFAVTEGTPSAIITVLRAGDPTVEVHVDYSTADGTATAPGRYTATSETLTFLTGVSSRTFVIPIVNDSVIQPTQTVNVSLSNPSTVPVAPGRVAIAGPATVQLTITSEDRPGTVAFGASTYTVSENGGSVVVAVTRTGGQAGGVTVDYAVAGGTAIDGIDYTVSPASSGTVTFAVNETTRTLTFLAVDNSTADGNKTIVLSLSNPNPAPTVLGAPSGAVVTIVDDEQTLKFRALGYSVLENHGPAAITVDRLGTATGTLLVDFATVAGVATAPADYAAVSRTLTFGPGVRTQSIPITIVNDTLIEGNESFDVRLSNPRFSPASATAVGFASATCVTFAAGPPAQCSVPVTIVDDDHGGQVQFSAATYTVAEGVASALINVVRTGGLGGPVTVDFITVDGVGTATALLDYTPVVRTLTFAANVATQTVTIPILNDTIKEANETVTLQLTNPGGGVSLGARDTAVLTITDNDVAGVVQFSQPLYTANEQAPTATITLTRTGGAASGVTVDFTTTNGTAVAGADYVLGNTTVTFAANQLTQTVIITLGADDLVAEGNKTVNLALGNPGGGATLGPRATAILTIVDSENTVQFSATSYSALEGSPAVITLERTGTGAAMVVSYATADGTGQAGVDYRTITGNLTFAPGVTTRTFTVPLITNVRDEPDRTVNLSLALVSGPGVLGPRSAAVLTIVDNDQAGPLAFSTGGITAPEAGFVELSVRRTAAFGAGPATVAFTTVDGTATAGLDYLPTSGVLTFGALVFSANFKVNILPNLRDDGDRSFTVELSAPTGGATLGTPSAVTVAIKNNDVGGIVQFSAATFAASECATAPCEAVLTVSRNGTGASGVTVDFMTVDGTATALSDYVATTGQIHFNAGQLGATIRIPLQIEPGAQPLKTFGVILTNPRGGATLGVRSSAQVRITDTR